jgi:hypothetical protein
VACGLVLRAKWVLIKVKSKPHYFCCHCWSAPQKDGLNES